MSQLLRKIVNRNGQDTVMTTDDIEYQDGILTVGEINDASAAAFTSAVRVHRRESNGPLTIYINSPGGSVSAGLAIYDTMNFIKCDVSTICIGLAASMGAFLLSSGTKGKRYALANSEIMIHQPLGGAHGQASDIEIQANHIKRIKEKINKILSENTGKDLAQVEKDTDRDNYMTAEQAKEYGLVDKIFITRE